LQVPLGQGAYAALGGGMNDSYTIAGHTFADTPAGRVCSCGKRWTDIASATRANIGEHGWAHHGELIEREADEITAEVARIWEAVSKVAAG
jgi:hypothetical protein